MRRGAHVADLQINLVGKSERKAQSHEIAKRVLPRVAAIAARYGAGSILKSHPAHLCRHHRREIYGPEAPGRRDVAMVRARLTIPRESSMSTTASRRRPRRCCWSTAQNATLGVPQEVIVNTLRAGLAGRPRATSTMRAISGRRDPAATGRTARRSRYAAATSCVRARKLVPIRELVSVTDRCANGRSTKDLLPVNYVVADMAGRVDSPLYGMFAMRSAVNAIATPGGGTLVEYFIRPPDDPYRDYSIKWDGESQITYETFRDMGTAYAVGLVLIYMLVVAHFGSYLTPLIIWRRSPTSSA
jgi:multidrug efflux pump subunit AcrB